MPHAFVDDKTDLVSVEELASPPVAGSGVTPPPPPSEPCGGSGSGVAEGAGVTAGTSATVGGSVAGGAAVGVSAASRGSGGRGTSVVKRTNCDSSSTGSAGTARVAGCTTSTGDRTGVPERGSAVGERTSGGVASCASPAVETDRMDIPALGESGAARGRVDDGPSSGSVVTLWSDSMCIREAMRGGAGRDSWLDIDAKCISSSLRSSAANTL